MDLGLMALDIEKVASKVWLNVNTKKPKALFLNGPNIEGFKQFAYLGSVPTMALNYQWIC